MKSIIYAAVLFCLNPLFTSANIISLPHNYSDTAKKGTLSDLLVLYYNLKDALVNSDASGASSKAGEFLNALNNMDTKALSETDKKAFVSLEPKLAFDARHISEVKSVDHQREHFATLSSNMYKLAKTVKLSSEPVYEMYCPMKKAYWLSQEEAIKNPYYGQQMLSCGQVADKIK